MRKNIFYGDIDTARIEAEIDWRDISTFDNFSLQLQGDILTIKKRANAYGGESYTKTIKL